MHIDYIICPTNIEDKLASKHNVQVTEARQVLLNAPRIRFAEKGHVPGMEENKLSSISKASTIESMGEFWDEHDFTEFDTEAPDVVFDINCAVPIEPDLLAKVEEQARLRGVSVETLVNLWLQQKTLELASA